MKKAYSSNIGRSSVPCVLAVTGVLASSLASVATAAEPMRYNEPTRHFTVERGTVAENRSFSVDLSTGTNLDVGGGVRLGLPFGELLLNSAITGENDNQLTANEATFKFGIPNLKSGNRNIDLAAAVYAGIAHIDIDDTNEDYTNFVIGGAGTATIQGVMLTVSPELEIADDVRDDTIFSVGFAAAYTFNETGFGRFQPNLEYVFVTGGDDDFDEDVDDDQINLGVRWLFKDNVNMDFIMLANGRDDISSLPGIVRLNVSF